MSDEDVAREVIAKVGLWWPAADENRLRSAADAWREFADSVDRVAGDGSAAAHSLVGSNSGPAVDAFDAFWARYDGGSEAYLPAVGEGARSVATACDDFATAVVSAKHRVEELAVEVGATLLVGTALAIFTFGAAEAAAAGISAGLISSAAAIGVELSATAASIAAGVITGAAFGAVEAAAVDVVVAQPIRVEAFHDGGFSFDEVESSLAGGAALGGLLGGAASGLRVLRTLQSVGGAKGPSFTIDPKQFGRKIGKHAEDYGLDPTKSESRQWVLDHVHAIRDRPDEVKTGAWNPNGGGGTDYWFYRLGDDVVVCNEDGAFVTILKNGVNNAWFNHAAVR